MSVRYKFTGPFRLPQALYAGFNTINNLKDVLKEADIERVFIITDNTIKGAGPLDIVLTNIDCNGNNTKIFDRVEPEPSIETTLECLDELRKHDPEAVIGVGGGSVLDVAKLCAAMATSKRNLEDYYGIGKLERKGLFRVLIPTTAGTGAEVTPNALVLDKKAREKKAIVSKYLIPDVAIVDPQLTVTMPKKITAASGMDALTHAIESFISIKASLHTEIYARESIKLICSSLKTAYNEPENLQARYNMCMGSLFAAISMSHAGSGPAHALGYPLGGIHGISHGVANSMMLPYVLDFYCRNNVKKLEDIGNLIGISHANTSGSIQQECINTLINLAKEVKLPLTLDEVGINKDDLAELVSSAATVKRLLKNSPVEVTRKDIETVYSAALNGDTEGFEF